jgi:hypothetical protein
MLTLLDKRGQKLHEIDGIVNKTTKNKESKTEQIKPIHQGLNIYSKFINLYCGPYGSGKKTAILRGVIKPIYYYDDIHMIVYVTNKGSSDDTFKTLEALLLLEHEGVILHASDSNLPDGNNKVLKWKQLYNDIKDG